MNMKTVDEDKPKRGRKKLDFNEAKEAFKSNIRETEFSQDENILYEKVDPEMYKGFVEANKGSNIKCILVEELGYLYFRELHMGEIFSYFGICQEGVSGEERSRVLYEIISKTLVYPYHINEIEYILNFLFKQKPLLAMKLLSFLTSKYGNIGKCEEIEYSESLA
ncbi:hypothetical protein F0310_04580 (plasmid) [Borrelia sp. A-FGy1]|uniref:hypothetical protein n=1 Tax=Borrelia sp. A-FGy1 TaxID=2608247 RepID=UPI0015F4EDFD|nr:hypothetical protein [Borrelia sp. A-FGy1]QMU99694.1 hypothetical protein F0310_04580 [Borrelia sp. A-FGy1]